MTGYLYAIEAGDAVKVGWSAAPHKRFGKIKSDNPADMKLAGYVRATKEQEQNLHRLLAPWRIRREWYRREGGILVLLSKLPPPASKAARRPRVSIPDPNNPIAAYRFAANLTLEQVAVAMGIRRVTVWRWEQGRVPDPEMWPTIIKATPITRQQLIKYAMARKYAEAAE